MTSGGHLDDFWMTSRWLLDDFWMIWHSFLDWLGLMWVIVWHDIGKFLNWDVNSGYLYPVLCRQPLYGGQNPNVIFYFWYSFRNLSKLCFALVFIPSLGFLVYHLILSNLTKTMELKPELCLNMCTLNQTELYYCNSLWRHLDTPIVEIKSGPVRL